ncbi:MAG: PRC-barrel domain-containing protein [Jatrophihabitantaceae bacterium]
MRASELIGLDVVDAAQKRLGMVIDLRCVQDGPLRGAMQAPRVAAIIVSGRHTGSLLGYDRRAQQGPWLIRTIVQLLHRHAVLIPWQAIADTSGPITLRPSADGLQSLPE